MERGLSKTDLLTHTLGCKGSCKQRFPNAYLCYNHPSTFSYSTNSILLLHLACVNPFTASWNRSLSVRKSALNIVSIQARVHRKCHRERRESWVGERGEYRYNRKKICLFPACCYGWVWIWFNAKSDVTLTIGISFLGEDVDSCSNLLFRILLIWSFGPGHM